MRKLLKFFSILLFLIICTFFLPYFKASAENLPSITIINLIRGNELGHKNDNLAESLKDQWSVTKEAKLDATWLLQYSALENKDIANFAKNNMPNQEFGLLFEIDRNFAGKSNVLYRGQGEWYFSDGLLLTSYDLSERRKLIDAAFEKFKSVFGYYPKTVGAWWIGADSISYMQEKYGITAVLKASDQFNLDFYSIWGTPFSIPYLSSNENEGIPADSFDESSKVVILQWAARDPLKGYKDPLYSVQDFPIKSYDTTYVDYLSSIFLKNPNDNLVFGLENGGDRRVFNKYYKTMLDEAKKLSDEKIAGVSLVKDYSNSFLNSKNVFPSEIYLSKDFNSNDQSFWYYSSSFRINVQKLDENIYLNDLHDYSNKIHEDFSILPNSQAVLRVDTPSIFDSNRMPNGKILLGKSKDSLNLKKIGDKLILNAGAKEIMSLNKNSVEFLNKKYNFTKEKIVNDQDFLFDRKELFILQFIPFSFMTVENSLVIFKLFPFTIFIISGILYLINIKRKLFRSVFIFVTVFAVFLNLNFPYFPLDRSTIKPVALFLTTIFLILTIINIFIFQRIKSKKEFVKIFFVILVFTSLLGSSVFLSRSKYIINPFEISALEKVQKYNKEVLFVAPQEQFGIKSIYKEIKPALDLDYKIGQNLTGKKWTEVVRPKNHILKISNYKNKLIFVPRYLGADLSDYEIKLLRLKKIFDNGQIGIFESI